MTFEVLLHRLAFVTLIISLFMLLIIPVSDFVGFMSLHDGLFMKSGLWSFHIMNASLLVETSTRSSSLRFSAIFLVDSGNLIGNAFIHFVISLSHVFFCMRFK